MPRMSRKSILVSDELHSYIEKTWMKEPDILVRLRAETDSMPEADLQISADQGQLMSLLVRALGVKNALEIGVFTGYSSLSVALALPDEGKLVACDISDEYTQIARKYWAEAGVANKVDLRIGPAVESLKKIQEEGHRFDFAFIDADKPNYENYFDAAVELVRPNGLIAIDNVFWKGAVADPTQTDEGTETMRAFNAKVSSDPRVDICIIPIGDGLTVARVR